jgi:shikimate kinase
METNKQLNVFLIGYMGAGKTTIGRLLAKKLNWSFVDIDGFIETRYHKTITAIFEEKGEAGFREIERRVLLEISAFEKVIISTGGGLPCFFDNMELMNRTGVTVYLKETVDELVNRLNSENQKRPLIKGKSSEELREFVETNLGKREIFYNQATFTVDVKHCPAKKEMEQWIEELLTSINFNADSQKYDFYSINASSSSD